MPSEMIKRIAKVLHDTTASTPEQCAVEVLKEMRHSSLSMHLAGDKYRDQQPGQIACAGAVWTTMIDDAIAGAEAAVTGDRGYFLGPTTSLKFPMRN